MPLGAGKYDYLASMVRMMSEASAVIVVIANGNKGSGFSVQAASEAYAATIPDVLEDLAREIRAATAKGEQ